MSFLSFLDGTAVGGASSASTTMGLVTTFVPFVLIFAIFYFFLIRPQNKKQKETEKMIAALKKGDKVVTIGGIHGVVSSTKEKTVILKLDDNCKVEFSRSAIATVEVDEKSEKKESKDDSKKESSGDL